METVLDITKVYGMDKLPALNAIPSHTVDFQKDYGLQDLTADSILKRIKAFEDNKIDDVLAYLTDKLGLNHLV